MVSEQGEWDKLRDQLITRASTEPEEPNSGAKIGQWLGFAVAAALLVGFISGALALSTMLITSAASKVWPSLAMFGLLDLFQMSLGLVLGLWILSASFRVRENPPRR